MADKSSWLERAKQAAKKLVSLSSETGPDNFDGELQRAESLMGYDHVSQSILLGSGKRQARSRFDICRKWHFMMGDPIISTALRAHVTSALGADEDTGQMVFIDTLPEAEKDPKRKAIVDEIKRDLSGLFNRVAHQTAFNACGFGDSYARVYTRDGEGVVDLLTDEMVYPPLVQPYCRGNQTAGYVVSTGSKFTERLSIKQLARAKMPRMLYVPQVRVTEKSMRVALAEDDIDQLPLLPDMLGGSFLEAVEEAYDNLVATLVGLVGQRVLNSIDESMLSVNLEGMTVEQRKEFMGAFREMLKASKQYAAEAVKRGMPVTERRFHLIPTFNDKQVSQIQGFSGTSGAQSISVEDVMFHAKLLAGALGIDLSMLGFSDILSGGLGEGGFFRTSVQAAERSKIIRTCLDGFYWEVIDIHTQSKYGWVFDEQDRPLRIAFAGSISALEAEKQASRERAVNSATLILAALEQMKNLGMGKQVNEQFMEKFMDMDEDLARQLAQGLEEAKQAGAEDGGGFGGGGFGGGGFGGAPRRPRQMATQNDETE